MGGPARRGDVSGFVDFLVGDAEVGGQRLQRSRFPTAPSWVMNSLAKSWPSALMWPRRGEAAIRGRVLAAGSEAPLQRAGRPVPTGTSPASQINGPTIYGGYGCPDISPGPVDNPPPFDLPVPPASTISADPGEEKILVLQRGQCFFSEKVETAQKAGYNAVAIANHHAQFGLAVAAIDIPEPDITLPLLLFSLLRI